MYILKSLLFYGFSVPPFLNKYKKINTNVYNITKHNCTILKTNGDNIIEVLY